ncbi:4Fe-4S single cluster domain-containing protein [Ottowia thiooxydans]|uniref:Anaerobic ribonucleoside-triphosphate reductase activating protein n=1 Tax=Ottowia thiooxydans TaxID=219182 RepID=A0ABV2QG08_9BURK
MKLSLSRIHYPVTTLGPGRRIGIWFQGCSIRCAGCISRDTWRFREGDVMAEDVIRRIAPWMNECDGVTISGGEPFDQAAGLFDLLKRIKAHRRAANVLVYSGYDLERLDAHQELRRGLIDALITDPYVGDADQTKPLRGSDNQRLHFLSELGEAVFGQYERQLGDSDKSLDVMFDDEGTVWLAGIPRKADMHRLAAMLRESGHVAHITEAPKIL